jgi:adenylylsulfate kinase
VLVLSSFISPYVRDRELVRQVHEDAGMAFIEVFVDCSLDTAELRDPKGLYKKARAGEIKNFTGIDDPYEAPQNPEIHLRTDQQSLEQEVAQIIEQLQARGLIPQ